jgi:hypothetical protein
MQTDGKKDFWKTIGDRLNARKFGWLHAGMHQPHDSRLAPTPSHFIQVGLKCLEVDMNVGID